MFCKRKVDVSQQGLRSRAGWDQKTASGEGVMARGGAPWNRAGQVDPSQCPGRAAAG